MAKLTLVGLGNIGSALAPLLARNDKVDEIILVDPDCIEAKNLASQNIGGSDIGKFKVDVVAHQLHNIRQRLKVRCFKDSIESVPWGKLASNMFISCVDNRRTRQYMCTMAWRFKVPFLDAGVNGEMGLIRANVYDPRVKEAACIECDWSPADYALLEQRHACDAVFTIAPTGASAQLGTAAATLLATEVQKLLSGGENTLTNKEFILDMTTYRSFVVRHVKNLHCRFDHKNWSLKKSVALDSLVGEILERDEDRLYLQDACFATRLVCDFCDYRADSLLYLTHRLNSAQKRCKNCSKDLVSTAADIVHDLRKNALAMKWLDLPLAKLGFENSDIATLERRGELVALLLDDKK